MQYVVKSTFKLGGGPKAPWHNIDSVIELNDKDAAPLLEQGLVILQKDADAGMLDSLEKKVAAKKAELASLQAQCDEAKKKLSEHIESQGSKKAGK